MDGIICWVLLCRSWRQMCVRLAAHACVYGRCSTTVVPGHAQPTQARRACASLLSWGNPALPRLVASAETEPNHCSCQTQWVNAGGQGPHHPHLLLRPHRHGQVSACAWGLWVLGWRIGSYACEMAGGEVHGAGVGCSTPSPDTTDQPISARTRSIPSTLPLWQPCALPEAARRPEGARRY